jgi:hypothetical protein
MLVGHAEKAVRIRELEDHLSYLLRLRDELGFIETSERQIGYGTNATKTIEKRFAPGLSKEIRETMRDLKAETEGAERAILADTINIQQNTFDGLSQADRDQILNAIAWKPTDIPVEIIEDAEGNVIARKPIDVGW